MLKPLSIRWRTAEELDGYEVHDDTDFASPDDSVDQELVPGLILNTAVKHTCRVKKPFKP